MELYFSPLACSMATRIALYEADGDATYLEVAHRKGLPLATLDKALRAAAEAAGVLLLA